ncbi:hypothetical protein C1645_833930 [Glomus cerebriforme]|uniref:Uncharacterized protein n=1 Tax=Glomus cerebriforme TaxID=658196 RepID=A0A397SHC5_9GLOM|nr:hypothetical protein C1645_833930 [Glomus cerebriforme]
MHDNRNLSEKLSDGYERLYPSISAFLSNISTSSNSAMIVLLLMLTYFTLSVSETAKKGLLLMTSDSSLVTVKSEKYSLRWQNTEFKLTIAHKFLNMQLEIDSLKEQVNELKDENAKFKDMVNGQNVGK